MKEQRSPYMMAKYFRQCLIEADYPTPSAKTILNACRTGDGKTLRQGGSFAVPSSAWDSGQLDAETAERIFELLDRSSKNKRNGDEEERGPQRPIELAVFPRMDVRPSKTGRSSEDLPQFLLPVGVVVQLERNGELCPIDRRPWVPRKWLSPNGQSYSALSTMTKWDEFLMKRPAGSFSEWGELKAYTIELLGTLADTELDNETFHTAAIHEAYVPTQESLFILETPVQGASKAIIQTLEGVIALEKKKVPVPQLFQKLASPEDEPLRENRWLADCPEAGAQHFGQMTGEFPLAAKQRNALHHCAELKSGDILAVNGPPGTGKTTLIRSIVADLWTKKALAKTDPPIIVATSNNNQAITNILDSFDAIQEDARGLDPKLAGRWLPGLKGHGLYLCAQSKANDKNPYQFCGPRHKGGTLHRLEDGEWLREATDHYLKCAARWRKGATSLDRAIRILHDEMLRAYESLNRGMELVGELQESEHAAKRVRKLTSEESSLRFERERFAKLRKAVSESWVRRPWWSALFGWVPAVGRVHRAANEAILDEHDDGLKLDNYSDGGVQEFFAATIRRIESEQVQVEKKLEEASAASQKRNTCAARIRDWCTSVGGDAGRAAPEVADMHVRYPLFKLATHYWEALWLKEARELVEKGLSDGPGPKATHRRLRRYAKLTPCFVATFYSLPNFFSPSKFVSGEGENKVFATEPMFGEIDLLIIDEAGQAVPNVASASFALADKAVVVGDTDQIEPVYDTPESVDLVNLREFGLLRETMSNDGPKNSDLSASSGNLMRMAQRRTAYHQIPDLSRGLYLTEHRRCYDEIIDYCNKLVYGGALEPKRGSWPKVDKRFKPFEFIPTETPSTPAGGSRINSTEAQQVADWIVEHQEALTRDSGVSSLCDTLAIVTPFKAQATLIREKVREAGLPEGITIGTVHSLQGGERPIVLFSSVYGPTDRGTRFYDRGKNMLNVAVSRAKNAFVVFGCPDTFGRQNSALPSGILREHIDRWCN